jgi:hypothetical protein
MKHKSNKKAQENILTDVIVTLVIVVIISASFFTANLMSKSKAEKEIKAKMQDIQSKRVLMTMLKTPIYGTDTFGDLIIQHYYDEKKGLLQPSSGEGLQQLEESPCISMNHFLDEFSKESVKQTPSISSICYNVGAKTIDQDLFLYKGCDYLSEEHQQSAHLPLENSYIEVYIQPCQCSRSVHKSYSAPEIYCNNELVKFAINNNDN